MEGSSRAVSMRRRRCASRPLREGHTGGERLLASRLRPVSSKAAHPPRYRLLHSGGGGGVIGQNFVGAAGAAAAAAAIPTGSGFRGGRRGGGVGSVLPPLPVPNLPSPATASKGAVRPAEVATALLLLKRHPPPSPALQLGGAGRSGGRVCGGAGAPSQARRSCASPLRCREAEAAAAATTGVGARTRAGGRSRGHDSGGTAVLLARSGLALPPGRGDAGAGPTASPDVCFSSSFAPITHFLPLLHPT